MFVTAFIVQQSELAGGPLPAKVLTALSTRLFKSVSRTVFNSHDPGNVAATFDVSNDAALLIIAKDKSTLMGGISRAGSTCLNRDRGPNPPLWTTFRGDYGGMSLSLVGSKFKKLGATIKGHDLFSRRDLRAALEQNNLAERGYFLIVAPNAAFVGPASGTVKEVPVGYSQSFQINTIARLLT